MVPSIPEAIFEANAEAKFLGGLNWHANLI